MQAELAAQEALRSVYGQNQYQSRQEGNGGASIAESPTILLLIYYSFTTARSAADRPATRADVSSAESERSLPVTVYNRQRPLPHTECTHSSLV